MSCKYHKKIYPGLYLCMHECATTKLCKVVNIDSCMLLQNEKFTPGDTVEIHPSITKSYKHLSSFVFKVISIQNEKIVVSVLNHKQATISHSPYRYDHRKQAPVKTGPVTAKIRLKKNEFQGAEFTFNKYSLVKA